MVYIAEWKRKRIVQMQIDDYIGNSTVIYFDMSNSSDRKAYEKLFGKMGIKKKRKRRRRVSMPVGQTKIDQFIDIYAINEHAEFKMPYHKKLVFPPVSSEFESSVEYIALRSYQADMGYLKNIFQFNSMQFWDEIPLSPEQKSLFSSLSMSDIFRLEMARYKRGIVNYKDWIDELNNTLGLLDAVQISSDSIPNPSQYGQMVHHLGDENIRMYFLELVNECIEYNLIDCKVIIWDGRFLESYCSKNKSKRSDSFSDIEAGMYKHISRYRGVGYIDSTFICGNYSLPVYYKVFPANRNDNIIFRLSFKDLMNLNLPQSYILIADSGPYSEKSLNQVRYHKVVPIIYAKKNIKEDVIKVAERKYANIKYIPDNMIPHLKLVMSKRYKVEWRFVPAKVCYGADRMINRGIVNAKMNIGKLKCIELLTALTAIKVHRPDLINSPTAFKDYRPQFCVESIEKKMSESNISLVNPSKLGIL